MPFVFFGGGGVQSSVFSLLLVFNLYSVVWIN